MAAGGRGVTGEGVRCHVAACWRMALAGAGEGAGFAASTPSIACSSTAPPPYPSTRTTASFGRCASCFRRSLTSFWRSFRAAAKASKGGGGPWGEGWGQGVTARGRVRAEG
jgi:hypothetical protein